MLSLFDDSISAPPHGSPQFAPQFARGGRRGETLKIHANALCARCSCVTSVRSFRTFEKKKKKKLAQLLRNLSLTLFGDHRLLSSLLSLFALPRWQFLKFPRLFHGTCRTTVEVGRGGGKKRKPSILFRRLVVRARGAEFRERRARASETDVFDLRPTILAHLYDDKQWEALRSSLFSSHHRVYNIILPHNADRRTHFLRISLFDALASISFR